MYVVANDRLGKGEINWKRIYKRKEMKNRADFSSV